MIKCSEKVNYESNLNWKGVVDKEGFMQPNAMCVF
jgi:hypothetical protein